MRFDQFEFITFDCYGTLIDWESGILSALRPVLQEHGVALPDEQILSLYAESESALEKQRWMPYKELLVRVMVDLGERLDFRPSFSQLNVLVDAIKYWTPFPDVVPALQALKSRYRLAVISNVDDDLFAQTAEHLQVDFDHVVTAEQARAYKPSLLVFEAALDRLGVPPQRVLHVASSLYHDVVPARTIGLSTVHVARRRPSEGPGAAPPAHAEADLEVPDLATLVQAMG